jgi:hypothetical protein
MFNVIAIVINLFFYASPQDVMLEDGFYLTVDCAVRNNVKRKNMLDDRKAVCLASHPIVSIREIEAISDLADAGLASYFDIAITARALDQFNTIRAAIKTTSIAVVINDKVLFVIAPDIPLERVLRITVFANSDIRDVRTIIAGELAKRD